MGTVELMINLFEKIEIRLDSIKNGRFNGVIDIYCWNCSALGVQVADGLISCPNNTCVGKEIARVIKEDGAEDIYLKEFDENKKFGTKE